MRTLLPIAALGTLLLSPLATGAAAIRGYTSQDAATAAALPIEIVIGPSRVEPQLAYKPVELPYYVTNPPFNPRLTTGQNIGANVIGNVLAAGIVSAIIVKGMRDEARTFRADLATKGCKVDAEAPIGGALATAIHAAWPASTVHTTLAAEARSASKLLEADKPRLVFQVSTGFAPDFSTLVTTIDVDAYPAATGSTVAVKVPEWHDTLILVGDQRHVPVKTQEEVDRDVTAENARFEALKLDATLAMLHKDAQEDDPLRHKDDYKRVKSELDLHQRNLLIAKVKDVGPFGYPRLNREWFLSDQCVHVDEAIAQSAALIREAIAAMASGQLPPPAAQGAKNVAVTETPGQRSMFALPGGVFISRRGGDEVALEGRYSYLAPEKDDARGKR